jgi:hypothetical protein
LLYYLQQHQIVTIVNGFKKITLHSLPISDFLVISDSASGLTVTHSDTTPIHFLVTISWRATCFRLVYKIFPIFNALPAENKAKPWLKGAAVNQFISIFNKAYLKSSIAFVSAVALNTKPINSDATQRILSAKLIHWNEMQIVTSEMLINSNTMQLAGSAMSIKLNAMRLAGNAI